MSNTDSERRFGLEDLEELEARVPNGIAKDWTYQPGRGRITAADWAHQPGKTASPTANRTSPRPGLYLVCRSGDGFMETIGRVVNLRWQEPFGGQALVERHDLSRVWHPIGAVSDPADDLGYCRADYLIVSGEEPVNA